MASREMTAAERVAAAAASRADGARLGRYVRNPSRGRAKSVRTEACLTAISSPPSRRAASYA